MMSKEESKREREIERGREREREGGIYLSISKR